MALPSRIDPLSWTIFVEHPKPEIDPTEMWDNPSFYPEMRHILHESVHFWHSISTFQGIYLAFDCLKSLNALRFASRKGEDLTQIGADWTFEEYKPFQLLSDFYAKALDPPLSTSHLFEGLARYWDVTICAGFTFDGIVSNLIKEDSPTYSEAYAHAYDTVGNVAFIIFPIFAYLALCSEEPVRCFDTSLKIYADDPFEVPVGVNFQEAWLIAWGNAAKWGRFYPVPYGPMSCYKTAHKRYVKWKMRYAGLVPEDFPLTGHPILEDSVQMMMSLAKHKWPDKSEYDLEVMFLEEFVFPGNPFFRQRLLQGFHPPVIHFSDGGYWVSPTHGFKEKPDFFAKSMADFSMIMGAANGLLARAKGKPTKHGCPHAECPVHPLGLCSFVPDYPATHEDCYVKPLIKHELGIAL